MIGTIDLPLNQYQVHVCGAGFFCTYDDVTIISTIVCALLTVGFGLFVAHHLTTRKPGKLQMLFELVYGYIRDLTHSSVSDDGDFVITLGFTLAFFILISNWIDLLPLPEPIRPIMADVNVPFAMALIVFLTTQWYSFNVLGVKGYFVRLTKPLELPKIARVLFTPLNIIEDIMKPVTLTLRLFGNIFAGTIMVALIAALAEYIGGLHPFASSGSLHIWNIPLDGIGYIVGILILGVWKAFDVLFIGAIQAFIFMLLTVLYFGMAREGNEDEGVDSLHIQSEHVLTTDG